MRVYQLKKKHPSKICVFSLSYVIIYTVRELYCSQPNLWMCSYQSNFFTDIWDKVTKVPIKIDSVDTKQFDVSHDWLDLATHKPT